MPAHTVAGSEAGASPVGSSHCGRVPGPGGPHRKSGAERSEGGFPASPRQRVANSSLDPGELLEPSLETRAGSRRVPGPGGPHRRSLLTNREPK